VLARVQRGPRAAAARRATLSSAICGGLSVLLLSAAAARLAGAWAALLAAAALASGGLFWTFATEAEVYALGAVFVAWVLSALARAEQTRDGARVAEALGAFALGLANHLSLSFAAPALLAACVQLARVGVRPTIRQLWMPALGAVLAAALYGSMPLAARAGWLTYSEYPQPGSLETFVAFVSAAKYRASLRVPSFDASDVARARALFEAMCRQWDWPLWAALPFALWSLARRSAVLALFSALALVGWLAFAFCYRIPDLDGFFVPVVVVGALVLGVGAVSAPLWPLWSACLALLLVPPGIRQYEARRALVAYDVLEDIGGGPPRELLDLPDLIARLPPGALLALPCAHYGCVQVANYYRFADDAARARRVEIVTLRGGQRYNMPAPPRSIAPAQARLQVVCTVQDRDRVLMSRQGVRMRTEDRGRRLVAGALVARVPLFCSVPERG
jgi:hypothetical protein